MSTEYEDEGSRDPHKQAGNRQEADTVDFHSRSTLCSFLELIGGFWWFVLFQEGKSGVFKECEDVIVMFTRCSCDIQTAPLMFIG